MDTSLKEHSERLDQTLRQLRAETFVELDAVNHRIDELNELLQMKEMSVDRSENASFQIAKDERDIKVALRSKLQKRLAVLDAGMDTYTPTGVITQGSTVEFSVITIDDKKPSKPIRFICKLVEHAISKAPLGFISSDGKVGSAFISKRAGDIVDVVTLKGTVKYKIERIY